MRTMPRALSWMGSARKAAQRRLRYQVAGREMARPPAMPSMAPRTVAAWWPASSSSVANWSEWNG